MPERTGLVKSARSTSDGVAVRERVDNTRVTLLRGGGMGGMHRTRAAFEILKPWENCRRLRCKFLDRLANVQAKVQAIAEECEAHANLSLDFVTSATAQIRISFKE